MDTRALEQIGLTRAESRVYLALLELSTTSSGPLIVKAGVSRSKVYDLLEKLKRKGLTSESIQGGVRHFTAAPPERILDYLDCQERELTELKQNFAKALPELKATHTAQEQVSVLLYENIEGLKTFFQEVLRTLQQGNEYCAFTFANEDIDPQLTRLLNKFHQERATKGIYARILINRQLGEKRKLLDFSNTKQYEIRTTHRILPAGVAIYGNNVATINWSNTPRVFVINCKENKNQYQRFFNQIWSEAKP